MAVAAVNSPPRRARGLRYALIFILLAFGGTALWTWLTLSWSYSDGTYGGLLQKFSRKGWFCKTEEGDLVLAQFAVAGVAPRIWHFSVRDPALGAELEKVVGKSVRLHYTEHPGIPSTCFGETRYFVDGFVLGEQGAPAPPTPPASPSSTPGAPPMPAMPAQPLSPGAPPAAPAASPSKS